MKALEPSLMNAWMTPQIDVLDVKDEKILFASNSDTLAKWMAGEPNTKIWRETNYGFAKLIRNIENTSWEQNQWKPDTAAQLPPRYVQLYRNSHELINLN